MRTIKDKENIIRLEFSYSDYFMFKRGVTNAADALKVRGCRKYRNYISDNLAEFLRQQNQRKTDESKYFVYCSTYNHGTKKYPDLERNHMEIVCLDNVKECAKSYTCKGRIFKKSNIIAYLYDE